MSFAFGLALVLLYMVLASQFNSFLQPHRHAGAAAGHGRRRRRAVASSATP
jgi:hypothetical protein